MKRIEEEKIIDNAPAVMDGAGVETGVGMAVQEGNGEPKTVIHKRMMGLYPDRQFENDDELFSEFDNHVQGLEDYKKRGMEANSQLVAIMESDPNLAAVLRDMMKGSTFRSAIARHFDIDQLKPTEEDEDFESWGANLESRKKEKAERDAYLKELDDNYQYTNAEFEKFASEKGLSEEELSRFVQEVDNVMTDLYKGKVSADVLDLFHKGLVFEKALEEAASDAEVRGKNAKIEVKKEEKVGDGLPNTTSATKATVQRTPAAEDDWKRALKNRGAELY